MPALPVNVEFGNAGDIDTGGTGWFVGFSEWSKSKDPALRYVPREERSGGLCIKWFMHQPGDPNGQGKPVSEGRTLSVLAGPPGEFQLEFSLDAAFEPGSTLVHKLRRPGDFVIWSEGVHHRWACFAPSCILTVRWTPQS